MLNIAGKPSETLHVELTDEVLTYIRGVMLHQMSEQLKLRSHPRESHEHQVDLSDVPGVCWSIRKAKYRAVHRDEAGTPTEHFTKNLEYAIKFTKTGVKRAKRHLVSELKEDGASSDCDNRDADVDVESEGDDQRSDDQGGDDQRSDVDELINN